jgi:uncharacterized repeat protein (TIGR03803 family)
MHMTFIHQLLWRARRISALVFIGTLLVIPAHANKERVLYSFKNGTDGANPVAGLTFDEVGNLYGVTASGGHLEQGTLFRVAPDGKRSCVALFHWRL